MWKVLKYKRTCESNPSQWEGILDDSRHFYARYRWSSFQVGLGDSVESAIADSRNLREPDNGSDGLGGFITDEEMRVRMERRGFDMSRAELDLEKQGRRAA